jgi:hypothetical protein
MVMVIVHKEQFEFSCRGICKAESTKNGQGDVSGITDILLQYSVTLCGASLVAGNAAADVFYSILTLSHALSTGLHRLACAILQAEPVFGRGCSRVFEDTLHVLRTSLRAAASTNSYSGQLSLTSCKESVTEKQRNDSHSCLMLSTFVEIYCHIH